MEPRVHFASRPPTVHHITDPVESLDNVEFTSYVVHIPPTPDNKPMQVLGPPYVRNFELHNAGSSSYTGSHNSVTRAYANGKINDLDGRHPEMTGGKCSGCEDQGCDGKTMSNEQGGKEPYDRDSDSNPTGSRWLSSVPSAGGAENKSGPLVRGQTFDFDSTESLFQTKASYGYGNAMWPPSDAGSTDSDGGLPGDPPLLNNKPRRPLTRKIKLSAAILSPYRLLVFVKLVALVLFLTWRIRHPNKQAMWLWGMSIACEIWFAFSWLLDQLPKLSPISRVADLDVLEEKFLSVSPTNPTGKSDLPGIDVFVCTEDPEKEPPLVTANTIFSILGADYPVEKLACYVSDDAGSLLTFEAIAEAASFANLWVPFCRKHGIEPRNPESYFNMKRDPYKNKIRPDFVRDRRRVKNTYDEFKVRINGLSDSIRRRSDAYNSQEEINAVRARREIEIEEETMNGTNIPKATWMADQTHWPGTWTVPAPEHSRGDHPGIVQIIVKPPGDEVIKDTEGEKVIDLSEVDTRLPLLVYVAREKRPGYDDNKKAGAMNALVRASAVMSNGPFILHLDCDHYIYNSKSLREGMCYMMDRSGNKICYVQFPQRFEGVDPSDRYAINNTVFFDVNMRALDGIKGPVYVGTGCLLRRTAIYGFDPPQSKKHNTHYRKFFAYPKKSSNSAASGNGFVNAPGENQSLGREENFDEEIALPLVPKKYGNSSAFLDSIRVAELQGRPLADHPSIDYGRLPGTLTSPREPFDASTLSEAISVVSSWYEDKTEWGQTIGWIYGSVTEDVLTGYMMHNRGWRSVYCVTKPDAFRGIASINLTDRLHQVLRQATGSVEIFFSRNNALLASRKMKFLQRIAYLNIGIYPFASIFLIVYCFLPALSLFSGQFIVETFTLAFLIDLLALSLAHCSLALLEIKWSGIAIQEWWKNEQFWLIGGTSSHFFAVFRGILRAVTGIEISTTSRSKSASDDKDDEYSDLYLFKWTFLMVLPITIMVTNVIAIAVAAFRTIYNIAPDWNKVIGGLFFSFWVLAHLYPFAKALMGRRRKMSAIILIWSGLIAITISLLWVAISPPSGRTDIAGTFQFP